MDEYSSRKAAGELSFSRKASARLALRDSADNRDRNSQLCSRVGCSSRMNVTKSNQIGNSGKAKITRHHFHLSSSGNEVVLSSSRTPRVLTDSRKSSSDPQKKLPCHQVANTEIISHSQESEASEPIIEPDNPQIRLNTPVQNYVSVEAGSSSSLPHTRNGKKTLKRSEQGTEDSSIGTSSSRAYKYSNHGVRNGANSTKYDFRNLKCSSVNDVAPSGCSSAAAASSASSSELNLDGKRVMGRKRFVEAEGSWQARGNKKINETPVDSRRNDNTSQRGISITSSRRARNSIFTRDNEVTPVGTQRSTPRARLNEQEERNSLRQSDSLSSISLLPQPSMPVETNSLSSEYQFPSQGSSSRRNPSRRPVNRAAAPFDVSFGSSLMNRENVSQYSLDGIAEMLLALDRIDQDEELTYERLLVLETNIFLSGLSFSDQHRDMRLDIDNMSYEELLALEERMGSVSTALTEEALEKCIKKSLYHQATITEEETVIGEEGDENKCSICQEEYGEGEEVGRLGCEHQYHLECIQQWLQVKNWCPICKSSAAPSPMASPSHSQSVS